MDLVPHDPADGVYASTPDYVHALEVRGAARLLFVAGTMGLDPADARARRSRSSSTWCGPTCGPFWRPPE